MTVQPIAWPAIKRIHADVEAIFSNADGLLAEGVPAPRVTFELPAGDPEPNHVFTLGTAHDFEVKGALSNGSVRLSFDVDVVCVATAATYDEAARAANAYQALLMQVTLCDPLLGGTVNEVGAPQVADYRTWEDQGSSRRHAGYRLSYNVSADVSPSAEVKEILKGVQA